MFFIIVSSLDWFLIFKTVSIKIYSLKLYYEEKDEHNMSKKFDHSKNGYRC